jgi:uncharacterized membrane protein
MKSLKSRVLLVASLAGVLALPAIGMAEAGKKGDSKEIVHCYGVNKCKGVGDCGGKGHSCAGQNSCKQAGYIDMEKDICLKIEGGRLTAQEKK